MNVEIPAIIFLLSISMSSFALWRAHVHHRRMDGRCRRHYDH